jgi:hypothetical protein
VYKTRLQNLFDACKTAIKSNQLYLTGLGRGLSNKNKTSSNIQKIDRLLLDNLTTWKLSHTFFTEATAKSKYLGPGILTKEGKVPAYFVAYKGKSKNRHKMSNNKKPSRSGKSKLHSQSNKEPWILASSIPLTTINANLAVNIYRQRMRIEENIRDTKCPHYGLGLKNSLSRSSERLGVLLLIAAIATFAAWLAGLETKRRGQAVDFQAHSAKFTSSLSIVFLGREALKKGFKISKIQMYAALQMLLQISRETQLEAPI